MIYFPFSTGVESKILSQNLQNLMTEAPGENTWHLICNIHTTRQYFKIFIIILQATSNLIHAHQTIYVKKKI